jgi:mRNA interferase MazF
MPKAGEIWLADIPFTSGAASKVRPVLVLWEDAADIVVAAVTKAAPRSATDVPLKEWATTGLVVASTVRLATNSGQSSYNGVAPARAGLFTDPASP